MANGAFVAGATGYTGREVVRLLCERGISTVAHVRPDSPGLATWRPRFEAMGAQVDETPWQSQAMANTLLRLNPAMIFLLLGTTRARAKAAAKQGQTADYETVDFGYTMQVIAAAEALPEKPVLVYVSMMGISPGTQNPYTRVRYRIETRLQQGTLPYLIARPAIISGINRDEFRLGERVGAVVIDKALGLAKALGGKAVHQRFASLTNTQLAAGLVRLATEDANQRRTVSADQLRL